jgi:hypothetical protein
MKTDRTTVNKVSYEATFSVLSTQLLIAFVWLMFGSSAGSTLLAVLVYAGVSTIRHGLHWRQEKLD